MNPEMTVLLTAVFVMAGFVGAFYTGYLLRPVLPSPPSKAPSEALARRAFELTDYAERTMDAGGEYKRHWVYARLLKDFPEAPKRAVSLAIEENLPE